MNYVFYDFETSGLNFYFDQPIQLAAKLVDENFHVLDELNDCLLYTSDAADE